MLKSFQFRSLSLLALSTALTLPSISFAGLELYEENYYATISKLGVHGQLPRELIQEIGKNIATEHSDIKIAMANTAMFTAITRCTVKDISTPAFSCAEDNDMIPKLASPHSTFLSTSASLSLRTTKKENAHYSEDLAFRKFSKEQVLGIPAYIWKDVVRKVKNLRRIHWSYLKGTKVESITLGDHNIREDGATELAQNLKGTNVHTVNLQLNEISDAGARDFAQNLQDTNVHTVNLAHNRIGNETQQYLRQTYPHIKWTF